MAGKTAAQSLKMSPDSVKPCIRALLVKMKEQKGQPLQTQMQTQHKIVVQNNDGSFRVSPNLPHMFGMDMFLGRHASPKLPMFAEYVRIVDEYFMYLISGEQVIGKMCYKLWVQAQAKIAKRVFLTWRKTLPDRPDQKVVPVFDPATRMEPAGKKRKVAKVDVEGADEDAAVQTSYSSSPSSSSS